MAIKSVREMVDEANSCVEVLGAGQALSQCSGQSSAQGAVPSTSQTQRTSQVKDQANPSGVDKSTTARLVDIRDIRELDKEGRIDGAIHAPRGMLEFWFDPDCPYHRDVFGDPNTKYVLFCAAGWRSALAAKALQDMGFDNIAHVDGGFAALKDAGARVIKGEAE